jgi:glycosyltransferase involved in cell wall biosynthesis
LSELGWLAASEAERMGKPWAVEVVGDPWNALWNHGTIMGKLVAPMAAMKARHWIGKARFAVYVTSRTLQKRYPCRGLTAAVSNVEIPPVDEMVLKHRIRKISEARTPLRIGLMGSLKTKYKGVGTAIEALAVIRERHADAELHVLGAGSPQPFMHLATRRHISGNVFFDGVLPGGAPIMKWVDDIDIYIQPSLTEGLPRALVEAMSRGCPALGSAVGGIPELLPQACLHRPGDATHLASLLQRAIADRAWREEQAHCNFSIARNYYTSVLEERRDQFWAQFSAYARSCRRSTPPAPEPSQTTSDEGLP